MNAVSRLSLAVVGLLALAGVAAADDEAALKQRFKKRFPALHELKNKGKVGETYEGYVEAVKSATLSESVNVAGKTMSIKQFLNEENADRKAIYAIIAKKTGAKPEAVAKSNAKRNFELAKSGHWLLVKPDTWQKKK
jgi:uncharacterized protein YdbL (DUF1318 family)